MKKLLASIVLLVAAFTVNAQSVSFKAGYTHSDVLVSPEPVNIFTPKETFHVGIVINDIQLSDKIGLQSELLYSMQGFKVAGLGNVGLQYLSVPLLLTFPVADGLKLLAGPQVSYLINSKIGVDDLFAVSYKGLFHDFDASAVAGLEYKVTDKVSIGGRYSLGLSNVNKDFVIGNNQNFSDYFQMKNTALQVYVSFGFGSSR
ncbi:Outer membrane protein beta-barrel domain-containing protein [Pseudarcicella hirudinis]|uniref:Outer membrane protein beta-barrel domain-containing protein n=1 Tax=Pseudarcicella hirudinis TaxID=1079859 RepID=A0A1I5VRV4_9BACT|nr:porin family protein [Pseudarcicella hirudinis]SFQ09746.1 Outer membrane protein beta-barrel domain-containing protein [Pseudarcicella hirudinis]